MGFKTVQGYQDRLGYHDIDKQQFNQNVVYIFGCYQQNLSSFSVVFTYGPSI